MADSGEKFTDPRIRAAHARRVWERYFTGTTAIHFGYKQVSESEREENARRRAKADIAMGIMVRAQREIK